MMPDAPGVYRGMTRAVYERIDAVNWSSLRHLKRSPAHYRAALLEQPEDTDAMRLGRATHVAVLEPERFRAAYAVWEGGRRYGKEWDAFRKAHADVEILTADQYQLCAAVATAARSDEYAAKYLRGGAAEASLLWTDAATGLACKGRVDFATDAGALVDLKTTRDASPEAFARAAWNLDYLGQAALYVDGHAAATGQAPLPYVIVAVESCAPHVVQVYRVPEHLLDMGRELYAQLLVRLAQCRRDGRWPGYAEGELELAVPRWARPTSDEDDITGLGLVVGEQ